MKYLQRIKTLKVILWLMFLIGFVVAVPSSIIPMLQQETFGGNAFVTSGTLSAVKGLFGFIYLPLLGAFSDRYGRKWALLLIMAVCVIPYALMLVGGFWVYSVANTFMGLYDGTMTLLLAVTSDYIPASAGVRTESFALVSASFFFGVSTAPFIGAFLTTQSTFIVCAGLQLFVVINTWFLLKEDRPLRRMRFLNSPFGKEDEGSSPTADHEGNAQQASAPHSEEEEAKLVGSQCPLDETDINKCPFLKVVAAEEIERLADDCEAKDSDASGEEIEATSVQDTKDAPSVVADGNTTISAPEKPTKISPPERIKRCLKSFPDLRVVTMVIFWNSLTEQMFDKLLLLYLQESLNFTSTEQAIIIAILGAGGLVGLLAITPFLKHYFGTLTTLRAGMFANAVVSCCYTFARVHWEVMVATGLSIFGMGVFPCAAALASTTVDHEYIGVAQGLASSARIAASGISPFIYGLLFQATQYSALPGASFLVGAGCVVISFIVSVFFSKKVSESKHH